MKLKKDAWEDSYRNKDNYVFFPHEEVIRFISKFIRRKIDIDEYNIIKEAQRALDLGCGIGRHVKYLDEVGLETYGIDLSYEAIEFAKKWFEHINKPELKNNLSIGSIELLPYEEDYFNVVISHGVLDSMSFEIAKKGIVETHRVMKDGGLFYLDLVSGDDNKHPREYSEEEIVSIEHERGTIQSYFNWQKIEKLINGYFEIEEAFLVQRESVINLDKNSRYHLILKKVKIK